MSITASSPVSDWALRAGLSIFSHPKTRFRTARTRLSDLKVKLFTEGADKAQIVEMAKNTWIAGFTTNPSLLKKAGVSDYAAYARDLVAAVPDRHILFEVFSDDLPEMVAQARVITTWARTSTPSCR